MPSLTNRESWVNSFPPELARLQQYIPDCMHPVSLLSETILTQPGEYQFQIRAVVANVRNKLQQSVVQTFHINMTDEMIADMQTTPNGEYRFPINVEDD